MNKYLLIGALFLSSCSKQDNKPVTAFDRTYYKEALKNDFLDQGLEVKIEVSGDSSEYLQLENPLFNEVWNRKFETAGWLKDWFKMGFKKVTLTDGHFKYKAEHDAELEYIPE